MEIETDFSYRLPYVSYKSGYKYQLHLRKNNPNVIEKLGQLYFVHELHFKVTNLNWVGRIEPNFSELNYLYIFENKLYLRNGYAWDGASGPTLDDNQNMFPSLIHDGLAQLMSKSLLPKFFKEPVDRELKLLMMKINKKNMLDFVGPNPSRFKKSLGKAFYWFGRFRARYYEKAVLNFSKYDKVKPLKHTPYDPV